ncbi:MAG: NifB/NifX family molybdenum-iron cluster-binding protein [Promethearchaeota archaeon]
MRVAVSSTGENLEAPIDPRFGRCSYYIVVDLPDRTPQAIPNEAAIAMHGAGIAAAQRLIQKGVQAVISGAFGPNAFQVLSSSGIQIFRAIPTTVKEALDMFEHNELTPLSSPSGPTHMGLTNRTGGGWSHGTGVGWISRSVPPGYQPLTPIQEKTIIKSRIAQIETELKAMKKRITELNAEINKES